MSGGYGGWGGQRLMDVLFKESDSPIGIIVPKINQFKYLSSSTQDKQAYYDSSCRFFVVVVSCLGSELQSQLLKLVLLHHMFMIIYALNDVE